MPHIVDGYNLLRVVQKQDERLAELAEVGLCRMLQAYLFKVRDHGHVVFDGVGPPDKSDLGEFDNLEVYFSGPNVEADEMIEEKIIDNTAPKSLVVVSSDRQIRAAAKRRKAISVRSDAFWLHIVDSMEYHAAPMPEPPEKRKGVSEGETEQWLDYFGIDD